jgi:hypothetical protein
MSLVNICQPACQCGHVCWEKIVLFQVKWGLPPPDMGYPHRATLGKGVGGPTWNQWAKAHWPNVGSLHWANILARIGPTLCQCRHVCRVDTLQGHTIIQLAITFTYPLCTTRMTQKTPKPYIELNKQNFYFIRFVNVHLNIATTQKAING